MRVVVSRCFTNEQDNCNVSRFLSPFRDVGIRATGRVYLDCRLVDGFLMAIMRRGVLAAQRPFRGVKRSVKCGRICDLVL